MGANPEDPPRAVGITVDEVGGLCQRRVDSDDLAGDNSIEAANTPTERHRLNRKQQLSLLDLAAHVG